MTGAAVVVQGNALALPLPDESVDLIVTSPPYFALRAYDGDHPAMIGSEPTPQAFLEALWAATAEMMRVLKPSGSIFINLGDVYSSTTKGSGGTGKSTLTRHTEQGRLQSQLRSQSPVHRIEPGVPAKSLMLLPERYRIGCVDHLGLIARAVLVWCLSGGARVYARLPSGDRPIMLRDLARAYQPEQVQLWNGHRWTQVLGWNRTPDDDGALELEFRSGERVGCTPGHQWPTTDGLKRADALRVGDVVLQTALPEPDRPHYPAGLNADDIGWLVGLYIAEGSRSETTIQIAGHLNETARHERLARIAETYDGTCAVYQTSTNGVTCNLHGPVPAGIIDQYVSPGTAKTKRLRKAAWQRSNQFLATVVEGYLDGDGHHDAKNQRWRLGFTANDEWAADLRTLAARLGARLRLRRAASTFNGRSFPGWRGEWRWQRPIGSKPDTEIVAIRRSRARDFYDLGVADEPHTFALASGVLTHNSKPNGLPESVRDRVRRSHEDWVHLTRQPRYYSAVDEVREPHAAVSLQRAQPHRADPGRSSREGLPYGELAPPQTLRLDQMNHPLGKLPGSVWSIPSEPLRLPDHLGVDHYAAFPSEWPRRLILGWSPPGICLDCGQGRVPVVDRQYDTQGRTTNGPRFLDRRHESPAREVRAVQEASILGYACGCTPFTDHPGTGEGQWAQDERTDGRLAGLREAGESRRPAMNALHNYQRVGPWREYHLTGWNPPPTRPALILDPFGGTGTTAMVARALGRIGISLDLSHAYSRAARWRIRHDAGKAIARTNLERQGSLL